MFKVPAPGDKNWHELMKTFRVRLDWKEASGSLFADEISLKEVESLDEWASWQALGLDLHSLIANPLFVNAAKDDYRLQPNSPAFKLGFQSIPWRRSAPTATNSAPPDPSSKPMVPGRNLWPTNWNRSNKP